MHCSRIALQRHQPYSVGFSATMSESVYRQDYLHERLQLWVDNLNLLYVAFTRAGKNLILWSKNGQKGTVSNCLPTLCHPLPITVKAIRMKNQQFMKTGRSAVCTPQRKKSPVAFRTTRFQPWKPGQSSVSSPGVINKFSQKAVRLPIHMEGMLH